MDRVLGKVELVPVYEQLKLFMHEGHDTNLLPLMQWLNPTNFEHPTLAIFASELAIDLTLHEECLEKQHPSEACFSVLLRYNDKVLEFEGACA